MRREHFFAFEVGAIDLNRPQPGCVTVSQAVGSGEPPLPALQTGVLPANTRDSAALRTAPTE